MPPIKKIIKRIPFVLPIVQDVRRRRMKFLTRSKSTEDVFTGIFHANKWKGRESHSGRGSDLEQTAKVIDQVTSLLQELRIKTVLDIPCGDFNWMKQVDLSEIHYIGADIVRELVEKNQAGHGCDNLSFEHLNLISDELPKADLLICRDCLVHLSNEDIHAALSNIVASGSEYLLATTFLDCTSNRNIVTGQWRPLNLELAPFHFPPAERYLIEGCTEEGGDFPDKALGLWPIEAINRQVRPA